MFQLEFKLRYLVQDALSYGRVFAVFDCCRVQMSNMPGLATGRGAGGNDGEEDEESGEESEEESETRATRLNSNRTLIPL